MLRRQRQLATTTRPCECWRWSSWDVTPKQSRHCGNGRRVTPPKFLLYYFIATRTLLEGKRSECQEATEKLVSVWHLKDPCARYYLARHLARVEDSRALAILDSAVGGGFFCLPFLARDPWLDSLRGESEFSAIFSVAEGRHREALAAFRQADGNRVLGLTDTHV